MVILVTALLMAEAIAGTDTADTTAITSQLRALYVGAASLITDSDGRGR